MLRHTLGCESRVAASKGMPSRFCRGTGSGTCASTPEKDLLPRPRAPPRWPRPRPLLRSAHSAHLSRGSQSLKGTLRSPESSVHPGRCRSEQATHQQGIQRGTQTLCMHALHTELLSDTSAYGMQISSPRKEACSKKRGKG